MNAKSSPALHVAPLALSPIDSPVEPAPVHQAVRIWWAAVSFSVVASGLAAFVSFLCIVAMAGCSTAAPSVIDGPLAALPSLRPVNIERTSNGSIFQPGMDSGTLFTSDRRPRYVGDTLKIDISEALKATSTASTTTSSDRALATNGPGAKAGLGLISSIMNVKAAASGNNSFKGSGTSENDSSFTGRLSASVINVLPNGNLVVAGEKTLALNGGVSILRFSGIVNPADIHAGNVVGSSDTVNGKLELAGRGEVSNASQRSWIQRVLADSLSVW